VRATSAAGALPNSSAMGGAGTGRGLGSTRCASRLGQRCERRWRPDRSAARAGAQLRQCHPCDLPSHSLSLSPFQIRGSTDAPRSL